MFLSNVVYRCTAVIICGMFLVIATGVAAGKDESAVVEQTVKIDENSDTEEQLAKDSAKRERLRKLLNITLVGTVLSNTGKPVAIFEDSRSSKQKFYRLNDRLMDMHITEILKDRVMLTKGGVEIEIRLNSGTNRGAKPVKSRVYDTGIDSSKSSTIVASVEELNNEGIYKITSETIKRLGSPQGFEFTAIPLYDNGFHIDDSVLKNSILGKLGLQAGDVIFAVNSRVPEPNSFLTDEFSQILDEEVQVETDGQDAIRIDVERGNKVKVIYLVIQDQQN